MRSRCLLLLALTIFMTLWCTCASAKTRYTIIDGVKYELHQSGDWDYYISDNQLYLHSYLGSSSSITIPSTLDGKDVKRISPLAFKDMTNLTAVRFHSGLELIGDYAFFNTGIQEVDIPGGLNLHIGIDAFGECLNLTKVSLGEGVEEIDDWAFGVEQGGAISSVSLPNTLKSIGFLAFTAYSPDGMPPLTELDIPDSVQSVALPIVPDSTTLIVGQDSAVHLELLSKGYENYRIRGIENVKPCTSLPVFTLSPADSFALPGCIVKEVTGVAQLGENNVISFSGPGEATVVAEYETSIVTRVIHVRELNTLTITAETVEDEAFSGTGAERIVVGAGVQSIGEEAFAYCPNLLVVRFESDTYPEETFLSSANEDLTIIGPEGSTALDYAYEYHIRNLVKP